MQEIAINKEYLNEINTCSSFHVPSFFGAWINEIDELRPLFESASPFPHLVIDGFLNPEYAEKLHTAFPTPNTEEWHTYDNPIEVKFSLNTIANLPEELRNYFYFMSSNTVLTCFQQLTGIQQLEYDEYLHGAGLHAHSTNGKLNVHLDYEKHPYSGKERRINVILFLSKDWKNAEWHGENELWSRDASRCIKKTEIVFNRAILFKTNDESWHGVPEPITCPRQIFRKSLAYYYVSPLETTKREEEYRKKAVFIKRPDDPLDLSLNALMEIRANRRIEKKDLERYCPHWEPRL
jgi:hypothetical protein